MFRQPTWTGLEYCHRLTLTYDFQVPILQPRVSAIKFSAKKSIFWTAASMGGLLGLHPSNPHSGKFYLLPLSTPLFITATVVLVWGLAISANLHLLSRLAKFDLVPSLL